MENAHELLKIALQPRISFALWITALIVLVVPLPDFLRAEQSVAEYSDLIKMGGLFTFIYWIVSLVLVWWESHCSSTLENERKKEITDHLETLSPDEKFVLARHIVLNQQTVKWAKSGEVSSLISKGLLDAVPSDSHYGNPHFTIPRFVWVHLQKNKNSFLEEARKVNPDKDKQLTNS